MKQYETYKDSGIQWLGKIPSHWETIAMKFYFYMKGRIGWQGLKAEEFIEEGPYLVTGTDFENGRVVWERCYHISDERYNEAPEIHVKKGDLLITKDGTVGKLAYIDSLPEKVSLNSHLLILRPYADNVSNHFMYWALQASNFEYYTGLAQNGSIMASLSQEKIGDYKLGLPSLTEQQAIASYLDYKVGQIDAAIKEKEASLEDLKAYRNAIISEAVTKGLDKNVPMKDSGVEWIGEIPANWIIQRVKFLLEASKDCLKVGPFGSALSGNDFKNEGYWVYNQRTVLDNNFDSNDTFVNEEKYQELIGFSVKEGDFLITTRGTIGKVAIVPANHKKGVLHPCLIRFRVNEALVDKEFLKYVFNDTNIVAQQVKFNSNSTTIDVIYSYTLKELNIVLPPIKEQRKIVEALKENIAKLDESISHVTAQIADLKSYKSSVISEAVTGKVDLREWTPKTATA